MLDLTEGETQFLKQFYELSQEVDTLTGSRLETLTDYSRYQISGFMGSLTNKEALVRYSNHLELSDKALDFINQGGLIMAQNDSEQSDGEYDIGPDDLCYYWFNYGEPMSMDWNKESGCMLDFIFDAKDRRENPLELRPYEMEFTAQHQDGFEKSFHIFMLANYELTEEERLALVRQDLSDEYQSEVFNEVDEHFGAEAS